MRSARTNLPKPREIIRGSVDTHPSSQGWPAPSFLSSIHTDAMMCAMDISTRLDFAAAHDRVYAMMTDKAYLDEVCVASESISYDASVSGSATHTSRTLPAPDSAARFTGSQLTVIEDVTWNGPSSDGSRTADIVMTVLGQPVTLRGKLQMSPGGRGTIVALDGALKVAIPLLGKKLEESAAPAVLAGFQTQQRVGDQWLSR
jgi:hypothetical protein